MRRRGRDEAVDPARASVAFVVRVNPGVAGDRVSGIVERVKTGEKHRFEGAEAVGPLIVRMLRHRPDLGAQRQGEDP